METVLTALAIFVVVWMLAVIVAFLLVRSRLRRANRVVPDEPTPAPLSWLASPAAPARLHRRLRAAVTVATATPTGLAGVDDVRRDLTARAAELDRRLATAGRAKGPRRRELLRELAGEVDHLDALAHRIDRLAVRERQPAGPTGAQPELDRLAEQLTSYESAADELEAIERAVEGDVDGFTR